MMSLQDVEQQCQAALAIFQEGGWRTEPRPARVAGLRIGPVEDGSRFYRAEVVLEWRGRMPREVLDLIERLRP